MNLASQLWAGLIMISMTLSSLGDNRSSPFLESELIFPLEEIHNHSSCIVECPKGDLLVCWYHGSGERKADDVVILGARLRKGAKSWSKPFLMADTPGYPDTNPVMFVDPQKRLWLIWPTILANLWETALMKCLVSSDYQGRGVPKWERSEVLHITPPTNFAAQVQSGLDNMERALEGKKPAVFDFWAAEVRRLAADKLSCRLGWMPRAHPCLLDGKRLILPLYSDGFNFSLMAITDDWGASWRTSTPLVGPGNVQPSIAARRDGTLVAFMRDNGPEPHRVQLSASRDRGETWEPVSDADIFNPGAGLEVAVLKSGLWLLINNDLEKGRHSLAVSLSDDEGRTWKWTRHLERDDASIVQSGAGSYHYPSIIQAKDGTLHATYSYTQPAGSPNAPRGWQSIKHARFNEAWIRAGSETQP